MVVFSIHAEPVRDAVAGSAQTGDSGMTFSI
jgi:hypothetical protein